MLVDVLYFILLVMKSRYELHDLQDEINLTTLVSLRKEMAEEAKQYGVKLSYVPFFVKAASLALYQVWHDDQPWRRLVWIRLNCLNYCKNRRRKYGSKSGLIQTEKVLNVKWMLKLRTPITFAKLQLRKYKRCTKDYGFSYGSRNSLCE